MLFIKRYPIQILLALCFIPTLIIDFECHDISKGTVLNYFVGYATGFGGRKLIGTIFGLFLPEYVQKRHILPIVFGTSVLMVILFCYLICRAVPNKKNYYLPTIAIIILYLISPFSILTYLSSHLSIWAMETYMIVLVLSWLISYIRIRGSLAYYIITLVTIILSTLIHHTFCCLFLPLMLALFTNDILSESFFSTRKTLVYGIICMIEFILFIFIWQFSSMNIDIDTLCQQLDGRTSPGIMFDIKDSNGFGKEGIWQYYYATNYENRMQNAPVFKYRYIELVLSLVLMSPLLIIFFYPWIYAIQHSRNKKQHWCYILMPSISICFSIPIFFMATDYGRWWFCLFFCQFLLLLTMIIIKDRRIKAAIASMYYYFSQRPYFASVIYLYILFCLHADPWYGLKEACQIRQILTQTPYYL